MFFLQDKPVIIPESIKRDKEYNAPSFVRNVMGSSAGAGSGEFHVYRHLRRKEYARQKHLKMQSETERLNDEYQDRLEENQRKAEEKTSKKRAKRMKRKMKGKKPKLNDAPKSDDDSEKSDNDAEASGSDTKPDENGDEDSTETPITAPEGPETRNDEKPPTENEVAPE